MQLVDALHELLDFRVLHLQFIVQLLHLRRLDGDRVVCLAAKRLPELHLRLVLLVADKDVLIARVGDESVDVQFVVGQVRLEDEPKIAAVVVVRLVGRVLFLRLQASVLPDHEVKTLIHEHVHL